MKKENLNQYFKIHNQFTEFFSFDNPIFIYFKMATILKEIYSQ